MKLKDRIKTYNFWVSLASAILLIINILGKELNFSIDENLYNDLFTSFCSILVLLGIIVPPSNLSKVNLNKLNEELNTLNETENLKMGDNDCLDNCENQNEKQEEIKNSKQEILTQGNENCLHNNKINSTTSKDKY